MTGSGKQLVVAAAAWLLVASAGLAQSPGTPVTTESTARRLNQQANPTSDPGPIVSIDYKGGKLSDFVTALRSATKDPVNISLQGGAESVPVSSLTLKSVSVETALRAALGPRMNQQQLNSDGTSSWIMFHEIEGGAGGLPVYSVAVQGPVGPARRGDKIEVLSIQRLITGDSKISPDVVLTAIDTGLGLDREEGGVAAQIKFHPDSGLILVRGAPSDVGLASEIVSRMMDDHTRAVAESAKRRAADIERRARRGHVMVQLELAESELGANQQRLDRVAKLVDAGQETPEALAKAQLEVRRAEASRHMAQIDLQRLEEEDKAGLTGGGRDGGQTPGGGDSQIKALERRILELEQELAKAKDQSGKKTGR